MATKSKAGQQETVLSRLVADQKDTTDWRRDVTVILTQQTEILSALREDFKKYEQQEEKYQDVVGKFMGDTVTRQAVLDQKGTDQERMVAKMAENHESAMKLIREINNKVWLVTGAVVVYCPIIGYMAVKLFEHLTAGSITVGH